MCPKRKRQVPSSAQVELLRTGLPMPLSRPELGVAGEQTLHFSLSDSRRKESGNHVSVFGSISTILSAARRMMGMPSSENTVHNAREKIRILDASDRVTFSFIVATFMILQR